MAELPVIAAATNLTAATATPPATSARTTRVEDGAAMRTSGLFPLRSPRLPCPNAARSSHYSASGLPLRRAAGGEKDGFGTTWRGLSPPVAGLASVFLTAWGPPPAPGARRRASHLAESFGATFAM